MEDLGDVIKGRWGMFSTAFKVLDQNKDKRLDRKEFEVALEKSGLGSVSNQLGPMLWELIDKDQEQVISFREFREAFGGGSSSRKYSQSSSRYRS